MTYDQDSTLKIARNYFYSEEDSDSGSSWYIDRSPSYNTSDDNTTGFFYDTSDDTFTSDDAVSWDSFYIADDDEWWQN